MRVAKKAAVVTVPREPPELVAENIRLNVDHGHIHAFTLNSFADLLPPDIAIRSWGLHCAAFKVPYRFIEGRPLPLDRQTALKKKMKSFLNPLILATGKIPNKRLFLLLMKLDRFVANKSRQFDQMVFVIAKDPNFTLPTKVPPFSARKVLEFKVPLHYLK